jgi:predicted HAD superfamily Cof-like phosphohydrolase
MKVALQKDGCILRHQVTQFHREMGHPINDKPATPSDGRVRLRLRLITEEFFEILDACGLDGGPFDGFEVAKRRIESAIAGPISVNLPELTDGLADLDYVVEGCRLEFGIDGAPIADAIHTANMAKAAGGVRADGKRLKPPGWVPPDIEGELKKQGWKP